jgi:hypothetical protein
MYFVEEEVTDFKAREIEHSHSHKEGTRELTG